LKYIREMQSFMLTHYR